MEEERDNTVNEPEEDRNEEDVPSEGDKSYIYAIAPKLTAESSTEQVDLNKTPAFQCLDEVTIILSNI